MDKILITGGAGFIGSLVNKMVADAGYETVVLDNLSRGDRGTVVRGAFVEGDIADRALLDELFEKHQFAAVMHFAALIDVGESTQVPEKYYANNTAKTLILLEKMVQHHVKNFIFSSTAALYGNPKTLPITETHPLEPINPYGKSKLMVEAILDDLDINYVALRYFNAAGGDPDGEIKISKLHETNLIPLLLRHAARGGKPFTINGGDYPTRDGTCVRDYIHIYDLGTAHLLAMKHLLSGGKSSAYNLGNGVGFTVKEIVKTVEAVTDKTIEATIGPRRAGDPPTLVADAAKAKQELLWSPKYLDLDSIIAHAWNAYSNPVNAK